VKNKFYVTKGIKDIIIKVIIIDWGDRVCQCNLYKELRI